MSIMTRQERERLVLDLYNQGKTIREIAKEARMSFRDIGVILNKAIEEKTAREEGIKQDDGEENQEQEQINFARADKGHVIEEISSRTEEAYNTILEICYSEETRSSLTINNKLSKYIVYIGFRQKDPWAESTKKRKVELL